MNFTLNIVCSTIALVLIIFTKEGFGIQCWECTSDDDPKCADPFDNSTFPIIDCNQLIVDPMPMCRKIKLKVDGAWKYIRSCAYSRKDQIEVQSLNLMRLGTYNIFMEYSTCDNKHGCNVGSLSFGSPVLIISSILTLLKLMR